MLVGCHIITQQFKKQEESMVEIPAALDEDDWCALWFVLSFTLKASSPTCSFCLLQDLRRAEYQISHMQ